MYLPKKAIVCSLKINGIISVSVKHNEKKYDMINGKQRDYSSSIDYSNINNSTDAKISKTIIL